MPNSYLLYTANGSNTDFSLVGIDGWISSGFLKVYVNEVLQTTGYSFINITSASPLVRFATAPANGAIVRLQRETPSTVAGFQGNIVNFNDASVLTEADLDNMAKGLLHIAQEADDTGRGALPATEDGLDWNADSKRITQVGSPTQSTDAVTKGYVDGLTLYGSGLTTPQNWTFNGTGSQTAFQLTNPSPTQTDANLFLVEVGGVLQRPTTNYTVSSSGVLTFTTAPANGASNIVVRNWGVTRNVATFNDALTVNANFNVDGLFLVDAASNTVTTTVDPTFNGVVIGKGANSSTNPSLIIGSGNPSSGTSGNGANVVIGHNVHGAATTGANNTVVGFNAAANLTTGSNTVAIGRNAAALITTGSGNTAIGANALPNPHSGAQYNVAVGMNAGFTTAVNYTANRPLQSVYIGYEARGADTDSNTIVIGSFATSLGANTTVIGTASTVSTTFPGGILSIPGGGIKFPATQVPSADANTLDDYEEGSWTPAITFGGAAVGVTYDTGRTKGSFVKIGRTVFVNGRLVLTNKGSSTGFAAITGLTFSSSATPYALEVVSVGYYANITTPTGGFILPSSSDIQLVTGGSTSMTNTDFQNTTDVMFSAIYRTSN